MNWVRILLQENLLQKLIQTTLVASTYSNGLNPLLAFTNAGGVVYSYVATELAVCPIGNVKAEIDKYYDNPLYWQGAPVQVSGIFFNEMSNDLCKIGFYDELQDCQVKGWKCQGHFESGN